MKVYLDNCSYNRPFDDQSQMRVYTTILNDGINCLVERLGIIKTEIFISQIIREPFDYTKWQRAIPILVYRIILRCNKIIFQHCFVSLHPNSIYKTEQ